MSLVLFKVDTDDLSKQSKSCNSGCMIGDTVLNIIMCADDLVGLSPSSAGLQQLPNVGSVYGTEHHTKRNAPKSVVLICR